MKMPTFKIGQQVLVDKYKRVVVDYDSDDNRFLVRWGDAGELRSGLKKSAVGVVVGAKNMQEGKLRGGGYVSSTFLIDPDYERGVLHVKRVTTVWLVRLGYLNRPLRFFPEDMLPVNEKESGVSDVPWLYQRREKICRQKLLSEL